MRTHEGPAHSDAPESVRGLIEVNPAMDPALLRELVGAAHRLSRGGRVVVLLVDSPIDEGVLAQAREAEFVIAESERLSRVLLSRGILHMRAREGVQYLRSVATLDDSRKDAASRPFPLWW